MNNPCLKMVLPVAGCIATSAVLTLVVESLVHMYTPGWYAGYKLLQGPGASLVLALSVWLGIDFLLIFAVVWVLYVVLVKPHVKSSKG
jgi:hypothetical protein